VAGGDLAALHQRLRRGRQLQQAQRVGDVHAALAHELGHLGLGAAMSFDERAVALGLLDRREVGALDILDDGDLEALGVGKLAHQRRHDAQAGGLRGPPAALAGDDLELARVHRGPHQDRLQDPLGAHRGRQLLELGLIKAAAGLVRIRADRLDGDLGDAGVAAGLDGRLDLVQQGRQPPPQSPPRLGHADPPRWGLV
jgi:hypothetical protein